MSPIEQLTFREDAPDFLDSMIGETPLLSLFPRLREFRANLGRTPLVQVPGPQDGARIYAKYEFQNPFGSVKDRTAYVLVCEAVNAWDRKSALKLLAPSGGNMARALAHMAQLMDVPVRVVLPGSVPPQLVAELENLGVTVHLTEAEHFVLGIINASEQIAEREPDWTLLNQHHSASNVAIHELGTGQEIIGQLADRTPTHWVASMGSGATLVGVGRALRAKFPELAVTGVTPAELPYGTEAPPNATPRFAGAGGLGFGYRQPFVFREYPELPISAVSFSEVTEGMREFRELTDVRIGGSSAANWVTAKRLAAQLSSEDTVVTVFADTGNAAEWAAADSVH